MADADIENDQPIVPEEPTEPTEPVEPEEPEAPEPSKPKETLEQKRSRLQRELKQTEKKLGVDKDGTPSTKNQPSELTDDQLDFLDTKGVTEQEDIDIVQAVMDRTGKPLREVLRDDYVVTKLEANKKARAVAEATPASTRRGGSSGTNLDAAVARYEKTGEMPAGADFETRNAIINALMARDSSTVPGYKR